MMPPNKRVCSCGRDNERAAAAFAKPGQDASAASSSAPAAGAPGAGGVVGAVDGDAVAGAGDDGVGVVQSTGVTESFGGAGPVLDAAMADSGGVLTVDTIRRVKAQLLAAGWSGPPVAVMPEPSAQVIPHPVLAPAWVVMENFTGQCGDVIITAKAGLVVTDPNVRARMEAGGAKMLSADQAPGMVVCPHCHATFAAPQNRPGQQPGARRAG